MGAGCVEGKAAAGTLHRVDPRSTWLASDVDVPVAATTWNHIDAFGSPILGEPLWGWLGMRPGLVLPLQVGAVILGGIGSTSLIHRISERDYRGHAAEAGAPWVVIAVGLTALALWILAQPMDMRGTGFLS